MKKNIVKRIGVFLLMLCLAAGMLPADFTAAAVSAAPQASNTPKNEWVKKGNKYYYYNAQGKMLKNTWKTINNKKYYLGADGARKQNCWYTAQAQGGTKYFSYYFNAQGVFVKKAGNYKAIDSALVKKMDTIIKNRKITANTKADAAVQKIFRMMRDEYSYDRLAARGFHPESAPEGWEYDFAKEMLTGRSKAGSCYHYAAAMAFLVRRATGLPVRIGVGEAEIYTKGQKQSHGWVEVKIGGKWFTYDPLVAKNQANRKGLNYSLYRLAPVKAKNYYKAKKYIMINI